MSIKSNCELVMENIASAAISVGRNPSNIELIAVTKFVPAERIKEAVDAGVGSVGENRTQELVQKLEFFKNHSLKTHFIGQLQLNKVKYVIGEVAFIQSVDRLSLAEEINRKARQLQLVQDVLLQINIGAEAQKGGIDAERIDKFLMSVSDLSNIRIKGLMCIPPNVGEKEARAYFAKMRRLFESHLNTGISNVSMEHLSMGMSGDYIAAVKEGATMVRVGSAIFGARDSA